uniref:CARD domain-containing protein n=1 Tax=Macrostomum lignano TaxID=282301 RepID=A0A1I8FLB2_9PLAT
PLYATAVLLLIVALAPTATAKRETKTYTVNTGDGPVTVTETHVSETSSSSSSPSEYSSSSEVVETSGWSSSAKELLKDSKVSDMSAGDLSGSLVLAIDKNAISKGLKKYIMDALKKLPGWSLDRILARLQIELSKSRHAKRSGKVYDYVGIQAAYNELQKFGKSSGPRIVMLLSSGGTPTRPRQSSHSTIQYYKKIYGEAWEFYIVLKHYKTLYPGSWQTHLKTWFTNKYGDSTKFETYLHRTESKTGSPVSPEDRMRATFKKKFGSAWEKHFLIWKYKRSSTWKIHYEQHLMKKKYGKDWFSEWEKLRFKKKYGKKWEPHYVKWYFRKYRGATWIYSWKKWQFRQKHKEGSKAYVDEFMRWYFKYTKKGDKALEAWKSATKDLSEDEGEKKFRWFYYNLVFQKKQALIKYTKWFYRKRFGKKFLPKYKLWLNRFNTNKHWMKYYKLMETQLAYTTTSSVTVHVHSIRWFKKKFGSKWRTHYEKYQMKKKYGKNWFSEWEKLPFKKKYGKKWGAALCKVVF